jgi:hypothetical protein
MFAEVLQNIASWIWSFITGAFSVSNVDDSQWTAVQGLTNWWVVVMLTPLVIAMILQLLSGLISQQPRRLVRALVGGAVSIPMVGGAVYLARQLTKVGDSAAAALLDSMGTDPYVVFMRLFGFERAPEGSGREWNVVSLSPGTSSGAAGAVIVTAMAVIVVWILAFILMCSMIFRSFALIVLAAVAPVALMLMPWEKTKSWARRWCEIVVALLIAKPLAATVLAVAIKLFAESKSFAGLAGGAVGMALACGAPLMALRLVSFAGGELAAAAQTAGGGHVLSRSSSFTARQISRQTGGRFTLAGMAARSAITRPIPSSRPQFPTTAQPPKQPLPGAPTGATPSRSTGAGGATIMLDAGPEPSRQGSPAARGSGGSSSTHDSSGPPTPSANSKQPPPSASVSSASPKSAVPVAPTVPPAATPQMIAKPPKANDSHV